MRMTYRTDFKLTNRVNDYGAACRYLTEDNMVDYLHDDPDVHGAEKVTGVIWVLEDEQKGFIKVFTNDELTAEESAEISEWIRGQCSDGLGEGFEQQDFANYRDEDQWSYNEYDEEWVMASFDWETNSYILRLVEND